MATPIARFKKVLLLKAQARDQELGVSSAVTSAWVSVGSSEVQVRPRI